VAVKPFSTKPTLCIVESLEFLQEVNLREGEIISRTLRMSNKTAGYVYLRSFSEFEAFAIEFGHSSHRYLHSSCHANKKCFATTVDTMPADEFVHVLAPHVRKRRVFLSCCLAAESSFAHTLLKAQPECLSVVAPVNTLNFDDAAIFWTTFYHLMFKLSRDSMKTLDIQETVDQ
jgi:hypothetical protein